jgi:hypothetical protein
MEIKMNEKKLAANRMNAHKSTGPRSPRGKAASSKNSLKHGLLGETPIISGVESRKQWEGHRDAVLESFEPLDYPHKLLAIQLAVASWNMWRADRCEVEMAKAAVAAAELELKQRIDKPLDPTTARAKAEQASSVVELLKALPNMSDGETIGREVALATVWAFWRQLPEDSDDIHIPGVPVEDGEFNAFDNWTGGILRKALEVYAASARLTPEALMDKCIVFVCKHREDAKEEERSLVERGKHWELLSAHSRMLLQADAMDKLARYKSNHERSFFRILHELQRYQASRCGTVVAPPAVLDVDLNVHSDGSS